MTARAASASASASARCRAASGSVMPRRPSPPSLAGGQRLRAVAERIEIGDDVGAILRIGEADEGHLRALGIVLRLGEPFVELFRRPFLLEGRERRRELEAFALRD